MSSLVPFESNNLPSHLKGADVAEFNQDLTSHASGGFPIMSIKGKIFAVVRDGERKVLPNPKDPDSPATALEVVIIKANKATSKVYYAKGYVEGSEGVKPDCFSNLGDRPDAASTAPQSVSCPVCKHNQWGSKITENGSKGKACQDSVRIAIASPTQINDPMLLRVPPASIRALGELGQACAKRGVPYGAVTTKVSFELESPTPKLVFKPVGFLDDISFAQVKEVAESDIVKSILGLGESAAPAPAPVIEAPAPVIEAPRKAASEKAAPKKAPEVNLSDLNLDDINFDD